MKPELKPKSRSAPHNKRMQSDQTTRYARGLAADARRYVNKMDSFRDHVRNEI